MKKAGLLFTALIVVFRLSVEARELPRSVFTQRPEDPSATYFTPDQFHITADGRTDVSDALQTAIRDIKVKRNFGILLSPTAGILLQKLFISQRRSGLSVMVRAGRSLFLAGRRLASSQQILPIRVVGNTCSGLPAACRQTGERSQTRALPLFTARCRISICASKTVIPRR